MLSSAARGSSSAEQEEAQKSCSALCQRISRRGGQLASRGVEVARAAQVEASKVQAKHIEYLKLWLVKESAMISYPFLQYICAQPVACLPCSCIKLGHASACDETSPAQSLTASTPQRCSWCPKTASLNA